MKNDDWASEAVKIATADARLTTLYTVTEMGDRTRVLADAEVKIRVPQSVAKEWKEAASSAGVSLSELVRKAMDEKLHPFGK